METDMISKELEEKIKAAITLEDVVKVCAEDGIQITEEQLESMMLPGTGMDLNEDMLDSVSGGSLFNIIRTIYYLFSGNGSGGGGGRSF